jgi:acetyl-CoA carboxylase biotin carboxyl carrier protein
MDIGKLKDIVKLMVDNDLAEIEVRTDDETSLYLRRGAEKNAAPMMYAQPQMMPQMQAPMLQAPAVPAAAAPAAPAAGATPAGLVAIESPMVGTFYSAANPDSPPFAKPGGQISPDSVVCLIEAMKVFNEIKAEKSGVIEQVLVKNGEAVEFGQKLFLVRPS